MDLISLQADDTPYKLILAPNLRLIDDAIVDRLHAFVTNYGILVLNNRAATQNRDGSMRRALAPGPLASIAGVRSVAKLDLTEYNAQDGTFTGQDKLEVVFSSRT